MKNDIDHFTIGTDALETGQLQLQQKLGVSIPMGGKHTLMSTHNCVTSVSNDTFLELIAIDPDAAPPTRRRWFSLDDATTQARLTKQARALCWVVRTDNLDAIVESSPIDLGTIVDFSRGDRTWRLTVPDDGSLPEAGLLPAFIEWSPGPHPSQGMTDLGLRLESVNLHHPEPDHLNSILELLNVSHLAQVHQGNSPALSFTLSNTKGDLVTLE